MLTPEPLKRILHYPVTASLAVAALAVTGIWWSGKEIEGLFMDGRVWEHWELWLTLTSTLPHVSVFHLAFNLYWLWVFGALIERVYGHARTAVIFLLLAFTSAASEFIFLYGGVGLSGVGYGLWGFLWVLEKRDARFSEAVDQRTSQTFVIWFFLCIVMTLTNVMPVANIAHGVGAVTGAFLGYAISSVGKQRLKYYTALVGLVILSVVGSTVLWPWLNLSGFAQAEVERAGVSALERGDIPTAVKRLETATQMRNAPGHAFYNLGIAYHHQNRYEAALAAYERAARMPDATTEMQQAAKEMKTYWEIYKAKKKLH